jgi:L-ascorbate metabolism protein UlaG (beta-lactamase superfamily)
MLLGIVSVMTNTATDLDIPALLIGGPTLRFRYAGLAFLTDPTFDEPGVYPGRRTLRKLTGPAVSADEIGSVDVVLLSHDQHVDNLDHSGRAFLPRAGITLSTPDAAGRLAAVRGLTKWESVSIGEALVTAVPALHGPQGCEPVLGVVAGFVLTAPNRPTVYFSGDNASVELVEQIARRTGRIDLAILNVGAANGGVFGDVDMTLNSRTAVEAARALGDALVVPIHAEGWWHFSETLDRLESSFRYADLAHRLRILQPGVETDL